MPGPRGTSNRLGRRPFPHVDLLLRTPPPDPIMEAVRACHRAAVLAAIVPLVLAGPGVASAWGGPECVLRGGAEPLVCAAAPPVQVPWAVDDCTGWGLGAAGGGPDATLPAGLAAPVDHATARGHLERAKALALEGRADEALLHLRVLVEAYPHLEDRFALVRGMLLLAAGEPDDACDAFFEAADLTIDPSVKARARVAYVECHIRTGRSDAEASLRLLRQRYPELPQLLALELALAESREAAGALQDAIDRYRRIDLLHPGAREGARARAHLDRIAAQGTELRPMLPAWRVARAERLVASGPLDLARSEVSALLALGDALEPPLVGRLEWLAARLASAEGRWADAAAHATAAKETKPVEDEADAEALAEKVEAYVEAARSEDVAAGRHRVRVLRGEGPAERLATWKLRAIVDTAARVGWLEPLDDALGALAAREVSVQVAYDAALKSAGIGHDAPRVALLDRAVDHAKLGTPARYHRARALERLGRYDEAAEGYEDVVRRDADTETGFWALWAGQRLRWLARAKRCRCTPRPLADDAKAPVDAAQAAAERSLRLAAPLPLGVGEAPPRRAVREVPVPDDADALVARLDALADAHGRAFPWLARARDLLGLGEVLAAREELHEAYVAWRQAIGRPLPRAGLEAVLRGAPRGRIPSTAALERDRRRLSADDRVALARVAAALGDEGVAVGLEGYARAAKRPRAYAALVEEAAARHGLDPNLLHAVMRVESVYQERIISYAGAIGLMQIMPRTGKLAAHAVGLEDFVTSDLLDPATNLELSAWYLASLLERFDGRLPLAIASYNGGPHNVRRWMTSYGPGLAVEAFLERIPFEQTHRYVRRVLHHYAAYRAQQGLDLPPLHLSMPRGRLDPVAF